LKKVEYRGEELYEWKASLQNSRKKKGKGDNRARFSQKPSCHELQGPGKGEGGKKVSNLTPSTYENNTREIP